MKKLKKSGIKNIISLVEAIATDSSFYLVMELCNGGDLRDYMKFWPQVPLNHI